MKGLQTILLMNQLQKQLSGAGRAFPWALLSETGAFKVSLDYGLGLLGHLQLSVLPTKEPPWKDGREDMVLPKL